MIFDVGFGSFAGVVCRMLMMTVGQVSMMGCGFVFHRIMMLGGLAMMPCRMLMMLCCFVMMLGSFLGHRSPLPNLFNSPGVLPEATLSLVRGNRQEYQ